MDITHTNLNKENTSQKKKRRAKRHSNYFITINTNCRWDEHNEECIELKKKLQNSIDRVFAPENMQNLINITREGDKFELGTIERIKVESVLETDGEKRPQLHAHILVLIAHRTLLQLDYAKIKDMIISDLGRKIYFRSKLLRNAGNNLTNVMSKYMSKYIEVDDSNKQN